MREDVETTEAQLEKIENGMEDIKRVMETQHLPDPTRDIDSRSISETVRSTASSGLQTRVG